MKHEIIHSTDTSECLAYQIARVVYAETGAVSLQLVEALTSMIKNISDKFDVPVGEIITDSEIFTVLSADSPHHARLNADCTTRGFQMCVRVAKRMLSGALPDMCYGAVRCHHGDVIPQWSVSRGYIADVDGMLFYL